jgi:predicted GNAT family N-acyltransferase
MVTIDLSALPRQLQVKHQSATSAGLIARLAVDKNDKGRGIGEWLLADALKKLLSASEIVGFPLVVVDAKPGVEAFYQQYGFRPFVNQPSKLFMTVANIRKSLPV